MEERTLRCPNCGANATNHDNCEYCGSLLIRFVDKNIAIDENKYGQQAFRFVGLEDALKRNLMEQNSTFGCNHVRTKIKSTSIGLELDVTNPKSQAEVVVFSPEGLEGTIRVEPTFYTKTDEQSLIVCVRFYEITFEPLVAKSYYIDSDFNKKNKYAHERFKRLQIFKLFTLQTDKLIFVPGPDMHAGYDGGCVYQYYLNFGKDVQGAAAIISQYLLDGFDMLSKDAYNLEYRLESISDSEYNAMIKNIRSKTKSDYILFVVTGYAFILGAIWGLFDGNYWMGVGGLAMGPFLLWLAKKINN